MSPHRYTLLVHTRTAPDKVVGDVKHFTRAQQDEAWREWRAVRAAPSTDWCSLRYASGYELASYTRPEGEA